MTIEKKISRDEVIKALEIKFHITDIKFMLLGHSGGDHEEYDPFSYIIGSVRNHKK